MHLVLMAPHGVVGIATLPKGLPALHNPALLVHGTHGTFQLLTLMMDGKKSRFVSVKFDFTVDEGRRGKGMAESFSREKLRHAPRKEGG